MPIPSPVAADATGLPDSTWITDVRDGLEDYPRRLTETWTADGVNGPSAVNAAPVSVLYPKINDGSLSVTNSTTSTNYSIITTGTPTASQVLANYDTGELQFLTAPAVGNLIQVSYQTCKWRDQSILTGLYDGLRSMFPRTGKTYSDTTVQIQVNQWDYTLPVWFQDPRARLLSVEIADPYIPTEPFKPAPGGFRRVGLTQIHLPWSQSYSPVARLRIQGWGPYLNLSDLEPQLYHLPIWYALGVLLPKKEAKRIREDTMVPLAQTGGAQPGMHLQTGDYFARRFEQAMQLLARTAGPMPGLPLTTVYAARRY